MAATVVRPPLLPQVAPPLVRPLPDATPAIPPAFGFGTLVAFLFVYYSGVLDMTIPYAKIPLILGATTAFVALMSTGVRAFTGTRVGQLYVAFTGLMVVSALFGSWPGGSLKLLREFWMIATVLFFAITSFAVTPYRFHVIIGTIAAARVTAAMIGAVTGGTVVGRAVMASSRFSDPNDFALALLTGIPLWIYLSRHATRGWVRKAAYPALALMTFVTLSTGSRGAAIGACLMVMYLFFAMSGRARVRLIGLMTTVFVTALILLPPNLLLRYTSLVSDVTFAEDSREGRTYILKESLWLTLENPLLGVGPGQFPVAQDARARGQGFVRGTWNVTHNMYTQVSSEVGIPGAVIFCWIIVATFRTLRRVQREAAGVEARVEAGAFWLRAALVAYCGTGFFLSCAYEGYLPALAGLTCALRGWWVPPEPAPSASPIPPFNPVARR
jgi:O-antigen ligase